MFYCRTQKNIFKNEVEPLDQEFYLFQGNVWILREKIFSASNSYVMAHVQIHSCDVRSEEGIYLFNLDGMETSYKVIWVFKVTW